MSYEDPVKVRSSGMQDTQGPAIIERQLPAAGMRSAALQS